MLSDTLICYIVCFSALDTGVIGASGGDTETDHVLVKLNGGCPILGYALEFMHVACVAATIIIIH